MPETTTIEISPLQESEVEEAARIAAIAFGTFLHANPAEFLGDRDFMGPRWRSPHVKVLAARDGGRLIGSNVITRWGAFGFFGPLTVLPEFWDRGVASLLLAETMKVFDSWGLRRTGLFTFAHSPKHIGLYQKFGYWPQYLSAILKFTPEQRGAGPPRLSALPKGRRAKAIRACAELIRRIDPGLDLTSEIRAVLEQHTGDIVLAYTRDTLDGFAVCLTGAGSEGGSKSCYVKFAAVRGGAGAAERFDRLLDGVEWFAAAFGVTVEAGVNLAREAAFGRLRARGYRVIMQGVAMQRPHAPGHNRPGVYVIDDWR